MEYTFYNPSNLRTHFCFLKQLSPKLFQSWYILLKFFFKLQMERIQIWLRKVSARIQINFCIDHGNIDDLYITNLCRLQHDADFYIHVRTGISVGNCHVAYSEHSSQVNDPKWIISHSRMRAAVVRVIWISIAIHRPGWYSPMICITLVGWPVVGNVTVLARSWRNKSDKWP